MKTHIHKSTKNTFHFFFKDKTLHLPILPSHRRRRRPCRAGCRAGPHRTSQRGRHLPTGPAHATAWFTAHATAADVPNSFDARDIAYLALLNPFWESELVSWHLCSFGGDLLATTCALTSMHHATGQNLVSHLDINIIKTGLCMTASNSPVTCPTMSPQVPPLPCPNAQQPPCRLARFRFGMAKFKNLGWLATFRVFGNFEQKFNQNIQRYSTHSDGGSPCGEVLAEVGRAPGLSVKMCLEL